MPSDTHPYLLKEVFFLLLSPDIFKEFIQFQSWRLRVPGEKKKKEYGRKEEKQQVQPFPKDSWQKPPGGSDQSVPFRTSQLVTHRVWTGSLPGPAGISASTALVSIFLVISSRAFSGIMSRGQDGMGSYGRIVQINIIEGTGVLGEGGKESFWK